MISTLCLALALGAAGAAPKDLVTFSATLGAGHIQVGQTYTVDVTAQVNPRSGYSLAGRRPIPMVLQMKAPASIELTPANVKGGEHLRPPYEVTVDGGRRQVRFRVKSAPKPGDALVINLVGYVESADKKNAWMIRRRGTIKIKPGARLVEEPATRSDWQESSTLAIGDDAPAFSLPDKDGKRHGLSQFKGKKNVLVVTYRANW